MFGLILVIYFCSCQGKQKQAEQVKRTFAGDSCSDHIAFLNAYRVRDSRSPCRKAYRSVFGLRPLRRVLFCAIVDILTWDSESSFVTDLTRVTLNRLSHAVPYQYHTIPYHTLPYPTLPYPTLPYHTIPYHTIPYHTMPCHAMPYRTMGRSADLKPSTLSEMHKQMSGSDVSGLPDFKIIPPLNNNTHLKHWSGCGIRKQVWPGWRDCWPLLGPPTLTSAVRGIIGYREQKLM